MQEVFEGVYAWVGIVFAAKCALLQWKIKKIAEPFFSTEKESLPGDLCIKSRVAILGHSLQIIGLYQMLKALVQVISLFLFFLKSLPLEMLTFQNY